MKLNFLERARQLGVSPASPEVVQEKLELAKATLGPAQDRVGDAAYSHELDPDDETAAANLVTARRELADARQRVEELNLSLDRAIRARETATAEQRAKLRTSQAIALRNMLKAREEAGEKFVSALADVVANWISLATQTDDIARHLDIMQAPKLQGNIGTHSELRTAIMQEVWRVGGGEPSLPFAKSLDLATQYQPDKAPSLLGQLRRASDWFSANVINPPKDKPNDE